MNENGNEKDPITMDEAIIRYANRSVLNLYTDKIEMARRELNYEQLGILLCLIIDHSQLKDTTELESKADKMTRFCFNFIRQSLDYDREMWVKNCVNGSKGGRPAKDRLFAQNIEKRIKAITENPNETEINPKETQNNAKDISIGKDISTDTDISTEIGISNEKGISPDIARVTPKERVAGEETSAENLPPVPPKLVDYVLAELKRIYEKRGDFNIKNEAVRIIGNRKKDPNYDIDNALWHLETFGESF